jgi:hypothetical protein
MPATACGRSAAGYEYPAKGKSGEGPAGGRKVANRLLYGTPKAQGPEVGTMRDREDPVWVELVAQWTYGTVQRLAEKLKIGVEKWEGYPPEEIKESHLYQKRPTAEYLKATFGEFIVKDRDFRVFTLPIGK